MENNFQRIGSKSNTHVGREFEEAARLFFADNRSSFASTFESAWFIALSCLLRVFATRIISTRLSTNSINAASGMVI